MTLVSRGLLSDPRTWFAGAVGVAAASIAAAWYAEVVLHYMPCKLCLLERWPYYLGLPVGGLGLIAGYAQGASRLFRVLAVVLALIFLTGMALGIYHAGVEWHLWAGPTDCGGKFALPNQSIEEFRHSLSQIKVIRCDEAAMRILGLSFAGWNAVISLVVALLAGRAAYGSSSVSQ